MMCSSVSFSVATWKSVTEKPLSSEPHEKDGADEPELEELEPAEPEKEPEKEPEAELDPELELEPPFDTVPEIHFWVPRLPRLDPKPLPQVKPEKEKPP